MALASSTNSPLFEEALIPVSPPLGPPTVPASILLSHTHTQWACPWIHTHKHMLPCIWLSYVRTLCMTSSPKNQHNFHAGCVACDAITPWLLSGPLQMFENISYSLSARWKLVFVLVGKWCCTSWVSFSWVVFVWPFKGSPPVAKGPRKSINGGELTTKKNLTWNSFQSICLSSEESRFTEQKNGTSDLLGSEGYFDVIHGYLMLCWFV